MKQKYPVWLDKNQMVLVKDTKKKLEAQRGGTWHLNQVVAEGIGLLRRELEENK